MNLILFGFKGAGKSYFGKLLAEKLQRPFYDTDDLAAKIYHKETGNTLSAKEISRCFGEATFRILESLAIDSLEKVTNSIIATGGGAILFPSHRKKLESLGMLVYLDASYDTAKNRIKTTTLGPLEKLYKQRKPLYESIKAKHILIDRLQKEEALDVLASFVSEKENNHGL